MATNSETLNRFLGKGWTFPIQIDARGGVSLSSGEELVQQSIILILLTAFGERIMLQEFGSGLKDLAFEPNDDLLERLVDTEVRESLVRWEKRIDIFNVAVVRDPNTPEIASVVLRYRLIRENKRGNLVLPFFLQDETSLVAT